MCTARTPAYRKEKDETTWRCQHTWCAGSCFFTTPSFLCLFRRSSSIHMAFLYLCQKAARPTTAQNVLVIPPCLSLDLNLRSSLDIVSRLCKIGTIVVFPLSLTETSKHCHFSRVYGWRHTSSLNLQIQCPPKAQLPGGRSSDQIIFWMRKRRKKS